MYSRIKESLNTSTERKPSAFVASCRRRFEVPVEHAIRDCSTVRVGQTPFMSDSRSCGTKQTGHGKRQLLPRMSIIEHLPGIYQGQYQRVK